MATDASTDPALDAAIKSAIEKSRLVSELNELRQQLSDDQDRAVWGRSERMVAISRVIDSTPPLLAV